MNTEQHPPVKCQWSGINYTAKKKKKINGIKRRKNKAYLESDSFDYGHEVEYRNGFYSVSSLYINGVKVSLLLVPTPNNVTDIWHLTIDLVSLFILSTTKFINDHI